jgi:hypothetical protein
VMLGAVATLIIQTIALWPNLSRAVLWVTSVPAAFALAWWGYLLSVQVTERLTSNSSFPPYAIALLASKVLPFCGWTGVFLFAQGIVLAFANVPRLADRLLWWTAPRK